MDHGAHCTTVLHCAQIISNQLNKTHTLNATQLQSGHGLTAVVPITVMILIHFSSYIIALSCSYSYSTPHNPLMCGYSSS